MWWDLFFIKLCINFFLNDNFVYYVYLYYSRGISCDYWFIYFLLKLGLKGDGVGEN